MVAVEQRQKANGYTLRRQGKSFVFCRIGSKYGYLVGNEELITAIIEIGVVNVVVESVQKCSLMEQHLGYMQGKGFKMEKTTRSNMRGVVENRKVSERESYCVWEIRR